MENQSISYQVFSVEVPKKGNKITNQAIFYHFIQTLCLNSIFLKESFVLIYYRYQKLLLESKYHYCNWTN